jgi:hypothetical protein
MSWGAMSVAVDRAMASMGVVFIRILEMGFDNKFYAAGGHHARSKYTTGSVFVDLKHYI